jgi:hypothetical protein
MDSPTIATFAPLVETAFRLRPGPGDDPISLRLVSVIPLGRQPNAPRVEPFALEFAGPAQPQLEQRIYRLEHEALGSIEIFLVPIGFDAAGGLRYEAVFN